MRRTAYWIVVLAMTSMAGGAGAAPETLGWRVLTDATGSRVDYPADVFSVPDTPHNNVGGFRFRTPDGRADFSFFTVPTPRAGSPAGFLVRNLRLPEREVQYRRTTPSFFAVSGIHGAAVYYARCNASADHGMLNCIYLAYPASETHAWDAIVTRVSRSLHS